MDVGLVVQKARVKVQWGLIGNSPMHFANKFANFWTVKVPRHTSFGDFRAIVFQIVIFSNYISFSHPILYVHIALSLLYKKNVFQVMKSLCWLLDR